MFFSEIIHQKKCSNRNVFIEMHSAASSNELLDLHNTPTQTSEVRWGARYSGHWVVTSMFAQVTPRRTSHRQTKKTSNGRSSQLNVCPTNPIQFLNQDDFFKYFVILLTKKNSMLVLGLYRKSHTMDLLWAKFQWILPLYMKPISFQSKASFVCSVIAAIIIDFCLKKLNVFSQQIGQKTNEYLNSAEQIPRNWNVDQLSVLITSWDVI